jgi:hypothetical protein
VVLPDRRFVVVVSVALFLSCAATSTPVTNPRPASESVDAGTDASDAAVAVVDAAAPAKLDVRLEPVDVAPSDRSPVVEIIAPIAEQSVLVPKAFGLAFRISVEGWPLDGVACALDGERPRRYVKGMKLGDLLLDATRIPEGPHVLSVAAVRENGEIVRGPAGSRAPFAMVRFYVGERQQKPEPPRVILFEPSGTYNGEARANGLRIDFLAAPGRLGAEGGRARVKLMGSGVSTERELSTWQPLAIRDLPSGDFDVEVSLLDAGGKALPDPSATVRRTITVNRDAPVPKAE